jgi:opacity protein-like surface antigen
MIKAMKLRHFTSIGALSLCLALQAGAQSERGLPEGAGPYSRVGIGPSFLKNGSLANSGGLGGGSDVNYTVGMAADAAIGYAFNRYLAADFEFGVLTAGIDSVPGYYSYDSYLENLPFIANLTLSYPIPGTRVTPYAGAGVGSVTIFDTEGFGNAFWGVYGSDSDVVFAWQAFAGLRFEVNEHMSAGIGYKYFATGDASFDYPPYYPYTGPNLEIGFAGISSHSVLFSFEYKF